jgi:hypothetical protein
MVMRKNQQVQVGERNVKGFLNLLPGLILGAGLAIANVAQGAGYSIGPDGKKTSRISDEAVAVLDLESMPSRPNPILELGGDFLGPGNIRRGYELPTGAVWQPTLLVFGTHRSALQTFHSDNETTAEFANRLDLFANLQLTASERFVLGLRPLDDEGEFSSYQFEPDNGLSDDTGWQDETNVRVNTFFFEGDFGEIFPNLSKDDRKATDYGFVVGRQPVNYQAGLLINDNIDAIGVTRNTLLPKGGSDLQVTFMYGWNEIHRGDRIERENQSLYGLFVSTDTPKATQNFDFLYMQDRNGDTDGFFWGVSDVRRIGHYNLSSRIVGSHSLDKESSAIQDGTLVFAELSWTPAWTDNNIYINAFAGIDNFRSAARDPATGGPLGRAGILFAAIGMGRYGAPLSNGADSSVGGAIGYQLFINPIVNQFIFELGGRKGTRAGDDTSIAAGARYRHVFGQHIVAQVDVFGALNESRSDSYGGRFELRVEF